MPEKSIKQWHPVPIYEDGDDRVEMEQDPDGAYVKTHDHLQALGEAHRIIREAVRIGDEERERAEKAEAELQSLRADIAYVLSVLGEGSCDVVEQCEGCEAERAEAVCILRQAGGEGA